MVVMVKRQRRMTVRKKNSKKAASKMKPKKPQSRRSVKRKPASTMQGDRANQALKTLLKALKKEGSE